MRVAYPAAAAAVMAMSAPLVGCTKRDTPGAAAARDSAAAPSASAPTTAGPSSSAVSGDTAVFGNVVSVSDSVLTVSSPGGEVRVALAPPLQVYSRVPADLSRVTERTFVGVTSVPQPDGTQRATEIHIFPEDLRGLGEGSRPMGQQGGGGGRSTMTNGTVAGSRMTNGAARMTNGTIRGQAGGTLTVEYGGGSQTITVPPNVTVTAIAPTRTKPTAGSNVVVLASRQPDGSLRSSRVLLSGGARPAQ